MSISCTVCGIWYPTHDRDRLDICPTCVELNFSGAQPPILEAAPPPPDQSARGALSAFVDSAGPYQLTARQLEAMARLAEAWRRQENA